MLNKSKIFIIFLFFSLLLPAKSLKIATYNVENLFDMQNSGLEYKEYIPNRHNWTEPILRKKLLHTAQVICDLNADVIGLEEVESDRVLARLQKVLDRAGCRYPYRAITDTKPTPVHVALLSKVPFKKHRDVVIYRYGRQRSILEIDLKTNPRLKLFVNHWRSKSGPESKRIPYAKALMHRISKLPKDAEYLVLGDFNSNYNEYKTIDKKHNDTHNVTGINQILKTVKSDKLIRLANLSSGYHCNLWMTLAPYQRWSHNFYGDKEGIDAIIIPATLHDGINWDYKDGSFGVFRAKYLFKKSGIVNRWQYKNGKHMGKGYSDHLPVYATFVTEAAYKSKKVQKNFFDKVVGFFGFGLEKKTLKQKKTLKSEKPMRNRPKYMKVTIDDLYKIDKITKALILDDITVIYKQRDTAIIKRKEKGRAIMLYRCADKLQVGKVYDLKLYQKKRYKGVDEITDIDIISQKSKIDNDNWIDKFSPESFNVNHISDVVSVNKAKYNDGEILVHNKKYKIYFKKWAGKPPNGAIIRIKKAIIGYYKNHNELVVWGKKDYIILEK